MDKSLIDYLKQIPAHREPHGRSSSSVVGACDHNYGDDEWLLGLSTIREICRTPRPEN